MSPQTLQSYVRTVPSSPAVTKVCPPGANAADRRIPSWPRRRKRSFPVRTSRDSGRSWSRRHDPPAVVTESRIADEREVPTQNASELPGPSVPDPGVVIDARRDQQGSVGAEPRRRQGSSMPAEGGHQLSGYGVPELTFRVSCGDSESTAVAAVPSPTIRPPSGGSVLLNFPSSLFQSRTAPSAPPAASSSPSGLKASFVTASG